MSKQTDLINIPDAITVDGSNVGIGDSNPLSILHVGTGSNANVPITLAPSTGGNIEFRNTSSTGTFTISNGNGSSEKIRIDNDGLKFNGDTAAANALNDYEEGSCTLTLRGSTGAPNTAQTATGKYTKVGNTVTVTAIFANRDVTGATGLVQVTGFPFTSIGEIHLGHFANSRGHADQHSAYLPASSTNLYQSNKTGSSLSWGSTGSGTYAFLTITYLTT